MDVVVATKSVDMFAVVGDRVSTAVDDFEYSGTAKEGSPIF